MSVRELYECARDFLALSDMARYIIGTFFGVTDWDLITTDEDQFAEDLFRTAARRKELHELKDHIKRSKGITDAARTKLH